MLLILTFELNNEECTTMETLDAIMSRRSIRQWQPRPVEENLRQILLKAAMNAPSAADARPWQFVVIDKAETIQQFTQLGGTEMLAQAPLLLLICGEPEKEIYPGFWPQDCSCAAHNIQLAAHDQGLGCVWIAIHPLKEREEQCRNVLNIPEKTVPFALLALGHPAEELPPELRFDPERIHQNGW